MSLIVASDIVILLLLCISIVNSDGQIIAYYHSAQWLGPMTQGAIVWELRVRLCF